MAKISEVVTRYAIHNSHVGFTLKKQGDVIPQVRTPHNSTKKDNIKLLYGNQVARELLDIELNDTSYKFKMHSLITNPNYSSKRMTFLLFINHRLVDSTPIKKMLEDMYSIYIPKKTHPWCYISLEINPSNVDVNVHPTKHEVRFLHEDTIIDRVKGALDEKLSNNSSSRTFYVQARLPKVDITKGDLEEVLPEYSKDKNKDEKKIYAKDMIRTDANDQKLDKFNFTILAKKPEKRVETVSGIDQGDKELLEEEFRLSCPSDALTTPEPTETTVLQPDWDKIISNSSQASSSTPVVANPQVTVEISEPNDKNTIDEAFIPDDILALMMSSDDESSELPPQKDGPNSSVADRALKNVFQCFGSQKQQQDHEKDKNLDDEKKEDKIVNNEEKKDNEIFSGENKNDKVADNDDDTGEKDVQSLTNEETPNASQLSEFKSYSVNNFRREVKLTSVLRLRRNVEEHYHEGLKKILSEMIFVGCVKSDLALIQSNVNLYVCKTKILA